MKYWEIIADRLSKAGWSWGCVSALDSNGRTIWIAHADRRGHQRFVVHADEKLTAFLELESAIRAARSARDAALPRTKTGQQVPIRPVRQSVNHAQFFEPVEQ